MSDATARPASAADLERINEIYNHYVVNSPATFDIDLVSLAERRAWYERYAETGPHRLLVAEDDGRVAGYADTHQFRDRRAYDITVETTVYCDPDATGRGIGTLLYEALFEAIRDEDLAVVIAGMTLPNDASVALHERFGFTRVGVMHQVGRKFSKLWDVAFYEKRLR